MKKNKINYLYIFPIVFLLIGFVFFQFSLNERDSKDKQTDKVFIDKDGDYHPTSEDVKQKLKQKPKTEPAKKVLKTLVKVCSKEEMDNECYSKKIECHLEARTDCDEKLQECKSKYKEECKTITKTKKKIKVKIKKKIKTTNQKKFDEFIDLFWDDLLVNECGGSEYSKKHCGNLIPQDRGKFTIMGIAITFEKEWFEVTKKLDDYLKKHNSCLEKSLKDKEVICNKSIRAFDTSYLIPLAQVHYYKKLYLKNRLDEVKNVALRYSIFDFLVNSGRWSIRFFQRLCGVDEDGVVGSQTIAKCQGVDPTKLVDLRYTNLIAVHPRYKDKTFKKGWDNRISKVRRQIKKIQQNEKK